MLLLSPLDTRVPIVDDKGRPLISFVKKWQQQADATNLIPSLSTSEEMSAYLDLISNTANEILVRGTTYWQGLASPADATKFLNGASPAAYAQVKDSDLSLSDVTTNDVSTTQHGFAPKAPNDATKFLDGTGAYSTPASGSSQSEYAYYGLLTGGSTGSWGTVGRFYGKIYTAEADVTIGSVKVFCATAVSGCDMQAGIFACDAGNIAHPGTLLGSSATVTDTAYGVNKYSLSSPVTLAKGDTIYFGFLNTTSAPKVGASTLSFPLGYFSASSMPSSASSVLWTTGSYGTWWLSTDG